MSDPVTGKSFGVDGVDDEFQPSGTRMGMKPIIKYYNDRIKSSRINYLLEMSPYMLCNDRLCFCPVYTIKKLSFMSITFDREM